MYYPKSTANKPKNDQQSLGQVFTPDIVANEMVRWLLKGGGRQNFKMLDPCVGPGTFIKSVGRAMDIERIAQLVAVDIDPKMIGLTKSAFGNLPNLQLINMDYLDIEAFQGQFDAAILNPPYIRQEWIHRKSHYRSRFRASYGVDIPGTSNLYVYFIVKIIQDLKAGGRFSIVVYDSWQSTLYGKWLYAFLQSNCSSIEVVSAGSQPFDGVMIDATVIRGQKGAVKNSIEIEQHNSPLSIPGFKSISEIFSVKRGLRLKQTSFFIGGQDLASLPEVTRFVKKIGKVDGFSVSTHHDEHALIISKGEKKAAVKVELEKRLSIALQQPERNLPILAWFNDRPSDWYLHSSPPKAKILFNYYIRNRPRHILSPDLAFSDNFYGISDMHEISPFAWLAVLNSTSACVEMLHNSRNQGSGLAKLQLFEYKNCKIPNLKEFNTPQITLMDKLGRRLVSSKNDSVIAEVDQAIHSIYGNPILSPLSIKELHNSYELIAKMPKK